MSHLEVPHGEEDVPRATLCRKTVQNGERNVVYLKVQALHKK